MPFNISGKCQCLRFRTLLFEAVSIQHLCGILMVLLDYFLNYLSKQLTDAVCINIWKVSMTNQQSISKRLSQFRHQILT